MTDWTVTLSGLTKAYGRRLVLDVPELTVRTGESLALIGPNGSGKSTLIRLMAGAIAPTEGEIRLEGITPADVGYLPQKPYAFSFSALKNLTMAGVSRASAMELLEDVGLSALSDSRGDRLSGGEAQRLSVARLLARPRKLLLLDEPTSSTDIPGGVLVESALRRYMADTGCAVIFATHAPGQAERLAGETIFMNAGHAAERGETRAMLHSPRTPELRAFLDYR